MKHLFFKSILFSCVLSCTLIFTGCSEQESKTTQNTEEKAETFPEKIQKQLADNLTVSAECIYPDACKAGEGAKAKLSGNLFWDQKEAIAKLFFGEKEIEKTYENDYETSKEITFLADHEKTDLVISSNNYLSYTTEPVLYIKNVIDTDTRFDSYNGDQYQNTVDLDFISQDEAWNNIQSFLRELHIEASDSYTCYVMEHAVMEEEEKKALSLAETSGEKAPALKQEWSAEDDCYYFMTHASWEDYPVLPLIQGEGVDEENITILYNKDGILALDVNGYYPLEYAESVKLQSPEQALEKLQLFLSNIISEDSYEVQKITLCQKITGIDFEKREAEIVPAWEFRMAVNMAGQEDVSYMQKFYINAETLEIIE